MKTIVIYALMAAAACYGFYQTKIEGQSRIKKFNEILKAQKKKTYLTYQKIRNLWRGHAIQNNHCPRQRIDIVNLFLLNALANKK